MQLEQQTIPTLARRLRQGEVSAVELTRYFIERMAALDPTLNAFRLRCPERALAEAEAADAALRAGQDRGPLHGIPYVAKDLFDVRGLATSAGCRLLESRPAATDSWAVARLAAAGAVLLGKTNTVQLAYGGAGINHDHGTPHNPWHRTHHLPGGSSSGTAVAVASGMAPMGLGTDTGGSVRIPAALCGITGLKTTVGRVSRAGVYPLSFSLDSVGPLAHSVEEAALVYEVLAGPDVRDETTLGRPSQDVSGRLAAGARGLRVAFAETLFWDGVDPEVEAAVRACGAVFEELGAAVESLEFAEAAEAQRLNPRGLVIAAEAYAVNRELLEAHHDELDPIVASRVALGRDVKAHEYVQTTLEWKRLRRQAVATLRDVDVLLCPATMTPARPVAEVDADMETYTAANLGYLRNTAIGNILDLCGLSVPCGFTRQGLPIGLMIYGRPFTEDVVLQAGYAFQQATDWHERRPDLSWVGS